MNLKSSFDHFHREVVRLASSPTTAEETYYAPIRSLWIAILAHLNLPFEVRINTKERRVGGGLDRPDIAFYESVGDYLVVPAEVKLPDSEIGDLVISVGRNDQVGRYLAASRVLIVTNVRSVSLVTVLPGHSQPGAVPPSARSILQTVHLWSSATSMRNGHPISAENAQHFLELVETAVTQFAPVAEPESLARIFARQARLAKQDLPSEFSHAVRPLLEDFGKALGITFGGDEGEEFFRSSLVQTAFYGLFSGWVLWHAEGAQGVFEWSKVPSYLKIPFLGNLFFEFQHPTRLKELKLAKHLDTATATLARVDRKHFFNRFSIPDIEDEVLREGAALTSAAITYFYEPFLAAFDPDLRKELGVWYTPWEIVRYQVRRVDRLLRQELGCPRGFADESVVVLDPACGTGAYLVEILRCIAWQLREEGQDALMPAMLLEAFTTRIFGFEILMAPFVVALLQLYLVLTKLGADLDAVFAQTAGVGGGRLGVMLTNSLTGWSTEQALQLVFPELQAERDAAQNVKQHAKVIVIMGNPPYDRFSSAAVAEEAGLVDAYVGITRNSKGKQVGKTKLFERWGVKKHLLNDLYIRFFRLAEQRIGERADFGVVSFISNSWFYVGRSHPIMRESLLRNFDSIWIDNLHGNRIASERTPWGDSCETIFNVEGGGPGIKVGTAITTLVKKRGAGDRLATVSHRDFWGRAQLKRTALLEALDMDEWLPTKVNEAAGRPAGPRVYRALQVGPTNRWRLIGGDAPAGYEDWASLADLFPKSYMGVHTGKDGAVTALDQANLESRFEAYFSPKLSDAKIEEICPELMQPANEFEDPSAFRQALQEDEEARRPATHVKRYMYRPLDGRVIWYDTKRRRLDALKGQAQGWSGNLIQRFGEEFKADIAFDNLFLCAVEEPRRVSESLPLISNGLVDLHLHDRGTRVIPAWVMVPGEEATLHSEGRPARLASNLSQKAWHALSSAWSLSGDKDGQHGLQLVRDLFYYGLAILHSPQYQADNRAGLEQDWARLPITKSRQSFEKVVANGRNMALLLDPWSSAQRFLKSVLGEAVKDLAKTCGEGNLRVAASDLLVKYSYYAAGKGRWEQRGIEVGESADARWGSTTGDLYLNNKVYLKNVPARVWKYELGGYPVIKKWLGYRQANRRGNAPLLLAELRSLQERVHRVAAILCLHTTLDTGYVEVSENAFTVDDLGF